MYAYAISYINFQLELNSHNVYMIPEFMQESVFCDVKY